MYINYSADELHELKADLYYVLSTSFIFDVKVLNKTFEKTHKDPNKFGIEIAEYMEDKLKLVQRVNDFFNEVIEEVEQEAKRREGNPDE